jgi:hypothetical protein
VWAAPAHRLQPSRGMTALGEARREGIPVFGYLALVTVFNGGLLGLANLPPRRGSRRGGPEGLRTVGDAVTYVLATHGLSRLVATDKVTFPFRAPFVDRVWNEGELTEQPRGTGLRKALGELLTCPYCCSTWAAAALMAGFRFQPRVTRVFARTIAAAAAANFLHRAYAALEKASTALAKAAD